MTVSKHTFTFEKATLHFIRGGSGDRVLLLFHGFGQDCSVFEEVIRQKGKEFAIYSFDLFFHGESVWGYEERPIEKEFWSALMAQFLKEYGINRFSVGGYSIGARLALATSVAFSSRLERLLLIAPDGIGNDFIYTLATRPILLRLLFKFTVQHPGVFLNLSRLLAKSGILDSRLTRFAESQMMTQERRERVYNTWVVFRHLSYSARHLAKQLNESTVQVIIILGESDQVISRKRLNKFLQYLKGHEVVLTKAKHTGLVAAAIRENLI